MIVWVLMVVQVLLEQRTALLQRLDHRLVAISKNILALELRACFLVKRPPSSTGESRADRTSDPSGNPLAVTRRRAPTLCRSPW